MSRDCVEVERYDRMVLVLFKLGLAPTSRHDATCSTSVEYHDATERQRFQHRHSLHVGLLALLVHLYGPQAASVLCYIVPHECFVSFVMETTCCSP